MKDSLSAGFILLGLLLGVIVGILIQRGVGAMIIGGGIGLVIGGTLVDLYRRQKRKKQELSQGVKGMMQETVEGLEAPVGTDVNVEEFRVSLWFMRHPS
jgi:hypothetical protein